ncbi:MAG: TetR/AcrR family transcriptional regulator, partial [Candidatus Eiseniibacteriota bacterium]
SVMELRTEWSKAAEKILDAADRLLGKYGFRKMTVDSLAKEAGIGKGTVYLSFESKADVALACIDRMAARVLAKLEAIGSSAAAPEQRLREMLLERIVHRFDYARLHSSSIDDLLASLRPQLLEHRNEYFRAEADALATVLAEGRDQGSFEVADPGAAAAAMVTATNALLPYSLSVEELGRRNEILRRAHDVIHLLLRGVVAGQAART